MDADPSTAHGRLKMKQCVQRGLIEHKLVAQKKTLVGVDEVGRGCLAGPVFAACAILDYGKLLSLGIVGATFLAMKRALAKCGDVYDVILTDGNKLIPDLMTQQIAIVKGDQQCYCIAAASILAKQKRDFFMQEQAACFPLYGFDLHVGYGTKKHLEAIERHGICPLHRRNFSPISQMCGLKQHS